MWNGMTGGGVRRHLARPPVGLPRMVALARNTPHEHPRHEPPSMDGHGIVRMSVVRTKYRRGTRAGGPGGTAPYRYTTDIPSSMGGIHPMAWLSSSP